MGKWASFCPSNLRVVTRVSKKQQDGGSGVREAEKGSKKAKELKSEGESELEQLSTRSLVMERSTQWI